MRAGLKVGVANASQRDDAEQIGDSRKGLAGGAFLALALTDLLAVQVEALAIQKGWYESEDIHLHIVYAELPLLLVVRPLQMPIRPFVLTGVAPAVELSCDYAFPPPPGTGAVAWEPDCARRRSEKVDVGLALGGGLEWGFGQLNLALEGRYVHGVSDIASGLEYRVAWNRTTYVMLTAAMRL